MFIPDFKLVLPGGCNAKCSFCFNKKQILKNDSWIQSLNKALQDVPEQFTQLNITGGEPTISPYFIETLNTIKKYRSKFQKIVMTTNGSGLNPKDLQGAVDHINISRHHFDDSMNNKIFKCEMLSAKDLKNKIEECNQYGIDVRISLTLNKLNSTVENILKTIKFCKKSQALSLIIRNDYRKDINPSDLEFEFANHKTISNSSCPVCRVKQQIINDYPVSWVCGVVEPFSGYSGVREIILQSNGDLTYDYKGKYIVDLEHLYKIYDGIPCVAGFYKGEEPLGYLGQAIPINSEKQTHLPEEIEEIFRKVEEQSGKLELFGCSPLINQISDHYIWNYNLIKAFGGDYR